MTKKQSTIDLLADGVRISAALLDRSGNILEVSSAWKQIAEECGLNLPNHGVGQNYLSHCVHDPQYAKILKGLKQVLAREVDGFATLYPCFAPNDSRWFLLAAFPHNGHHTSAVLHFDVTHFIGAKQSPAASMIGFGEGLDQYIDREMKDILRRSIAEAVGDRVSRVRANKSFAEEKILASLGARQLEVLAYLGTGASNSEIAHRCQTTIDAVKSQLSSIVRKIGVRNRTEAALFAARNGVVARTTL